MDNASEHNVGSMSSIPTPENNFHYFLIISHGEEFAQLKPRLGILLYESNELRDEERITRKKLNGIWNALSGVKIKTGYLR